MKLIKTTVIVLTLVVSAIYGIVRWVQWGNATEMRPGYVLAKHEGQFSPVHGARYAVLIRPGATLFTWWCPATREEFDSAKVGEFYAESRPVESPR